MMLNQHQHIDFFLMMQTGQVRVIEFNQKVLAELYNTNDSVCLITTQSLHSSQVCFPFLP